MTRQRTDAGTRRIAAPKNAPAAPARPIQPGTRVCRWPGRDLLTGAHVTPDADVHVVSEYEWYGPRGQQREKAAEYGVASLPGLSREIEAGHRLMRMRAVAGERAEDEPAEDAEADEASA